MSTLAAYGGLFLAALVAATILPAQSEAVLGGLLATGTYSPVLLILVAGIGNVLGFAARGGFPSATKALTGPADGIANTAGGACC
jgi:hypothetical protein